jgi:biotin synthase-related radical SAM superfamily protein
MEIKAVLFAFTPIPNTPLADRPQPPLESYRRIQLARHLITEGKSRFEEMGFLDGRLVSLGEGVDIDDLVADGTPLKTTGCPGCNRPYYNERPSGPLFNYPRDLTEEELRREKEMLMRLMKR